MNATTPKEDTARPGGILVSVFDMKGSNAPIVGASVALYRIDATPKTQTVEKGYVNTLKASQYERTQITDADGRTQFRGLEPGHYAVVYQHYPEAESKCVEVKSGCMHDACIEVELNVGVRTEFKDDECQAVACPRVGDRLHATIEFDYSDRLTDHAWLELLTSRARPDPRNKFALQYDIVSAGDQEVPVALKFDYRKTPGAADTGEPAGVPLSIRSEANERTAQPVTGNLGVALSRTATEPTTDTSFFRAILNSSEGLSFSTYLRFMDNLFCGENGLNDLPGFEQARFGVKRDEFRQLRPLRLLPFTDADAYRVVKAATEAFVMVNCGVLAEPQPFDDVNDGAYLRRRDLPVPAVGLKTVFGLDYLVPVVGGAKTLPYLAVIRSKLPDIAIKLTPIEEAPERVSKCHGILQDKLANPCLIELIWSYWHEEGMLAQTMNAVARRFQNVRSHERDPLANLEIDPLRPLNNLLWGYVQDEQHRLSIVRRNYEYDHHYGLRLEGKAVARMQAADSRSRFLEAFHNLLRLCAVFFKQDDDTTVKADAFPVLNALKEVHLILSQGAHNQFGDLPSTARIEMLMQQWLLARPEFREFLPTRIMTAYPEPWMDRVDAMKKLQGWTDTSVLHFRNLAIFGEQILLTIRWGHWSDVNEPLQAFNWARLLRPQIQGYTHAYRAVTGVDLTVETTDTKVDATLPSVLLQRRLAAQQRAA
jgi:hypothetical protein